MVVLGLGLQKLPFVVVTFACTAPLAQEGGPIWLYMVWELLQDPVNAWQHQQ